MITIDPIRRPSKRNVTIEDINELNEKIKDITTGGIPDKSITTDKIVDGAVTEAKLSQAVKDTINNKTDKSVLDNYATTADVSAKADKSELANYATTEALAQKADASALNDKADKSALENFATKESLANFATKEEVKQMTETTAVIAPNILHVWGEVAELNITLADGEEGVVNEYMVQFASGATATTLTLPESIVWMSAPNIQANKTYQLSIINNLGVIGEFSV